MKKSINIWSFNPALSLPEKFALARDAGFTAIEIELAETGEVSLNSTSTDLNNVLRLAKDHELTISGLACGLYWGANAASADRTNRQKAADILNKQIEVAHSLDVDGILVVPGSVGVDFIPDSEVVPYEQAWERATGLIANALPATTSAGVQICVENVWNKFLLSPREMRQFIQQFDSPFVRCYLDIGNTLLAGYPEDWIMTLAGDIGRVHFKDFKRSVGTVDGFCELLAGDVNWPQVVSALKQIGYSGWVAGEMIPPVPMYKHAPDVIIYNTSRAMDVIFALD